MNATGPEARDPLPASSPEHEYFRAIEQIFVDLRGAPLLLSPSDWRLAERWFRQGLPLDVVRRGLEVFFARRKERKAKKQIVTLRYAAPAVEAAWEEVSRLAAAGSTAPARPFEVVPRLAALAQALPAAIPDRQGWAARIEALAGNAEDVEEALSLLDRELMARLAAGEDEAARRETARAVEAALTRLAERLPAEEIEAARERLERQVVRQRWGLSVLSLFSPEAEPQEPSP